MDTTTTAPTSGQVLDRKLPSSRQTILSYTLGGAGNGTFVASLPLAATKAVEFITHKKPHKAVEYAGYGMIALGAVVGAYYGMLEGKQVKSYRDTLNDHIDQLAGEIKGDRAKIAELTRLVQEKEASRGRA